MKPLAFAAENDSCWRCIVNMVVNLRPTLIKAINPEAVFLQPVESLRDIRDTRNRQVLKRARRGAINCFSERCCPALRNNHRICAGSMSSPDDSAKVMRIFYAVEHHEKFRALHDVTQFRIAASRPERDHILVRNALGSPIKGLTRLEANGNILRAAEINDFLQPRTGSAFGYKDL